jgi:tetratricopeptide (TPR) repeat protein
MSSFEQILHNCVSRRSNDSRIVFFVGAGISLDSPSNLPSTGAFIDAILCEAFDDENDSEEIRQFINPSAPKRLVDGHYLRFETFIEAITSTGNDPGLEILRCFSVCEQPNKNHYVLAALIGLGHYVVTTNFDCLIEIACQHLGIPCCQIVYETDFGSYLEAPERYRNPLFKIHGSFTKNGRNSSDSMNATLSSLAAMGDQMSSAPNKKKVLRELIGSYPVITLGYSGSDTFDIIPVFTSTPSNEPLIWVDHSRDEAYFNNQAISDLPRDPLGRFVRPHHDLLNRVIAYPGESGPQQLREVHLINLKTSSVIDLIVKQYGLKIPYLGNAHHFDHESHLREWFQTHIRSDFTRRFLQFNVWEVIADRKHLEKMLPILEQDLKSSKLDNTSRRILLQIAEHYHRMGKVKNAVDCYWKVVENAASQADPFMIVRAYNELSSAYRYLNEYPNALFALGQCVGWASAAIDASQTASDKAYATYLRADALFSRIAWAIKLGYPGRTDFDEKAVFGYFAYSEWKDEPEPRSFFRKNSMKHTLEWTMQRTQRYIMMHIQHAVAYCQEALDLAEVHSLDAIKMNCYSLYAAIDRWLGNKSNALEWDSKVTAIVKESGNPLQLAMLEDQSKDVETVKHAYHLYEMLGDLAGMGGVNYSLGYRYEEEGNWEAAGQYYSKALDIYRYIGDQRKQSHALHQLGRVAQAQKQFEAAADLYSQSLKEKSSLLDADGMAMTFKQLGHMYIETGNYEKALENMIWADNLWFDLDSPRQADVEPYLRYLQMELGTDRYNAIVRAIRAFREEQAWKN